MPLERRNATGDRVVARLFGIVPACGLSTRMGRAKALLDAGGRTFLARVISALETGGCRPVVVVVRNLGGAVAAEAVRRGALAVHNPVPDEGPISSIRLAVRRWGEKAEGCAVCPVDHPLVRGETVHRLATRFVESDACLVVPVYRGRRGHPTFFRRDLFGQILDPALPEGARTVVRRNLSCTFEYATEDAGVVADIDTPARYRRHFRLA